MKSPKIEQEMQPSGQESLETLSERMEALQGIVDEFTSEVGPALQEYEKTSQVIFTEENGYNDSLQRKNFSALVAKLASFESHVKAMFDLFDGKNGGSGLNDIFWSVKRVQERLAAAPDARYTYEAQVQTYGGKENIPAGNIDTFEYTQDAVLSLKSEIKGIRTALEFMHPTKVLQ
ncbi:hypothetical protein H6775_01410 [Candidatus Nomurabacteria bacterium]|nr:hypothetical protein [Candidatus Nomurabacteria bacterium]